MRERGQGLISVVLWLIVIMFSLWLFMLLVGRMLEPIRSFVINAEVMQDSGHLGALENFWAILTMWAPMLLGVGAFMLSIIYAVFREQFRGRRRVP